MIEGFTSTHEYIQYRKKSEDPLKSESLGRVKRPYLVWNDEVEPLEVGIQTQPARRREVLVFLDLRNSVIPNYLNVSLRIERGEEEGPDLLVKTSKSGVAWFELVVRHEDRTANLKEPVYVCLSLLAGDPGKIPIEDLEELDDEEYESVLKLPGQRKYEFMAGPPMGNTWIGIDPGTTGSCIAGAHPTLINSDDELLLYRENGKEKITPSRIAFDQTKSLEISAEEFILNAVSEDSSQVFDLFETGENAGSIGNGTSFESIKKLLGYDDAVQRIEFANGQFLNLTGSHLTGLMVRKLYQDFKVSLNKSFDKKSELLRFKEAGFRPTRAVVAIPNNFSPLQVQDAVDAIKFIPEIKEVRTIYEAEAVLLYCVRYKSAYFGNEPFKKSVLIFDMGGATINATNVDVAFDGKTYHFQIRGKIGYAIGGDSIDYYLGKVIIDILGDTTVRSSLFENISADASEEERQMLIARRRHFKEKVVTPLKLHVVKQFYQEADNLLTDAPASAVNALKNTLKVDDKDFLFNDEFVELFQRNEEGAYAIFSHLQPIYDSVVDAADDVLNDQRPEGVIFSGRSTLFPLIKEKVVESLTNFGLAPQTIVLEEDELKTSVAKGACLYGLLNNAFNLTADRVFENYGFTIPKGAGKMDIDFELLIPSGTEFSNGETMAKKKQPALDFSLQSNYVNFYQVNGKNALEIIKKGLKHKFRTVGQISTDKLVNAVGMRIYQNGRVRCGVWNRLDSKALMSENIEVKTSLAGENEPHYTWLLT